MTEEQVGPTITPVQTASGEPTLLEQLVAAVGMDAVQRAVVVGAGLAARADDLHEAFELIAPSNTARPAVGIVTAIALTAASGDTPPET